MSAPGPSRGARRGARVASLLVPLAVGATAFLLAWSALLPGQGFWDTGEFQAVPPLFGTAHPTGYPAYTILGWLASLVLTPLGEPALRMNALSALLVAVAAVLVVVLVRRLTGRLAVGVAAGLLLALTPIVWRIGGLADPHALHLALLAALLVLLAAWEQGSRGAARHAGRWLAASAVVYGIMLANHTLTILLAPGIALFVLAVEPGILRRPRFVLACAGLLVGTTAVLYLQLPLAASLGAPLVYGHPDTWEGFWYVVLAEQFRGDLVDPFGDLARKMADVAGVAFVELGVLAALVPAAFVVVAVRSPRLALLTGTWLLVTCWFAASYTNAAIDRYYLGPILLVVVWLALAAGLVVDAVAGFPATDPRLAGRRGALVAAGVAVALVLPAVLAAPATAARVDRSDDTRAADWSRWALAEVDRDAVLVTWWSFSTPLWYRTLVLGERPDVSVVDDRDRLDERLGTVDDVIRAELPTRPVYLVRQPAELALLETRWVLEAVPDPLGIQPLYRVVGPRPASRAGPARPSRPPPLAGAARPTVGPRAATMEP